MLLRKYGAAATIDGIPLITRGAVDFKASPTLAAGDVQISKNGGAFANLATLPTVTPSNGTSVQIALSATEMQAARVAVRFVDQTNPKEWEDQEVIIETFGHASAQHTGDLNNLDAAVSSRSTFDHTAETVLVGDKTGFSLSGAGVDAILDDPIEGTVTLRQAMRIIMAVAAGKSTGGGTATIKFRDVADSKDRVTAMVDSSGNRTAVTTDGA